MDDAIGKTLFLILPRGLQFIITGNIRLQMERLRTFLPDFNFAVLSDFVSIANFK